MIAIAYSDLPPYPNPQNVKDPGDYFKYCEDNNLEINFLGNLKVISFPGPKPNLSPFDEGKIAEDYFVEASMAYDIKTGELSQPKPIHNNPEDYGRTPEWAVLKRKQYLRGLIVAAKNKSDELLHELYLDGSDKNQKAYSDSLDAIALLEKNFEYVAVKKTKDSVDFNKTKSYPLVELISNYGLNPIRTGHSRHKISCPFHDEKTPSLVIYEDTNSWYCFGCGVGGDPLDFVQKYEKISPLEAAKKLSLKTY